MEFTSYISEVIQKHKTAFKSGKTLSKEFRLVQLNLIVKLLKENFESIVTTLRSDYKKPVVEVKSEINYCISKADQLISNLNVWMTEERVPNDILNANAKMSLRPQPYGNVLIIAPWNFPLILSLEPFMGALAAGNTIVLKTSELVPSTSALIRKLVESYLDTECYTIITEPDTGEILTQLKFDYVFYTGSTRVGRLVYQAISKNLTPATMELGGKCPCYVHSDTNVVKAAEKIAWIKTLNAGQICISIDYLIVHKSVVEELMDEIVKFWKIFYTEDIQSSVDYGRIVSLGHTQRLKDLIDGSENEKIFGGKVDIDDKFVEPTLFLCKNKENSLLKDEIFGPILPVFVVEDEKEAIEFINTQEEPLEIYVFTNYTEIVDQLKRKTISGGLTVNECYIQMAAMNLPFGGVGNSGFGKYHGFESFRTFSHYKAIYQKTFNVQYFDNMLLPPYSESSQKTMDAILTRDYKKLCNIL